MSMAYTFKQAMTDVLSGEAARFVPFAPRLDIWYRSRKLRGTLPAKYRNYTLPDVIDDLGVGYNTMIPDYLDTAEPDDWINRGTGFYCSNTSTCYTVKFRNVDRTYEEKNGDLRVTYRTPHGDLTSRTVLDGGMKAQGITICAKTEYLVKSVEDYNAAGYLFENAEVIPQYGRLETFAEKIGDRGVVTAIGLIRESPARLLQMELMGFEQFTYAMYDYPNETAELMSRLGTFLERCMIAAAGSCADVVTAGAHFDGTLTPPPFFRCHMLPYLQKYNKILRDRGKMMASHTDSDNAGLLELYIDAGIGVMDSVCTKPLTTQDYADVRRVTGDRAVLYGLIPSIVTLPDSVGDYDFDRFIDGLFNEILADGARNVILAVADTTPPGADLERVRRVAGLAKELKPG